MIAFYLRLSIADGDLGRNQKDESNSIDNQRHLLQTYFDMQEDLEGDIVEYVDDGYTGTNFQRPGFMRMIEDAKVGKIHTIMTKDLSRLGRDYIETGDYLEQIFPALGIRFIAVSSNYDSNQYIGKTIGLDLTVTNLINNLYSRDISKKITSAMRSKWKQGICTTSRLPYGYIRDYNAKGTWGIDPEAAHNVRTIFEKAMHGWSLKMIAEHMNENGIVPPGLYRIQKGENQNTLKSAQKERIWDYEKVRKIVRRYEYTGAFVNHYYETLGPGTKKVKRIPESERYVTENAHAAIVTKEEFYKAQDCIRIISGVQYIRQQHQYLFKKKIFCGNCRLALIYNEREYDPFYSCYHKATAGISSTCPDTRFYLSDLEHQVKLAINQYLEMAGKLLNYFEGSTEGASSNGIMKEKATIREMELLKADRIRQYEAFVEGKITKEAYLKTKQEITQKVEELQQEIRINQAAAEEDKKVRTVLEKIDEHSKEYQLSGNLTNELVDIFIEKIYVHDSKTVEVIFKYEDVLQAAIQKLALPEKGA